MAKGAVKGGGKGGKRADQNGPTVSKSLLIGAGAVFALIFGVFVAMTSDNPTAPPTSATFVTACCATSPAAARRAPKAVPVVRALKISLLSKPHSFDGAPKNVPTKLSGSL